MLDRGGARVSGCLREHADQFVPSRGWERPVGARPCCSLAPQGGALLMNRTRAWPSTRVLTRVGGGHME